jgi:hypothetical protein
VSRSSKWSLSLNSPHQNPVCTSHVTICATRLPIPFFFFWSPEQHLERSTDHISPRHIVFTSPQLPLSSLDQISSSAPYSRTTSAYVLASIWASKFHTHTNHRATL